MIIFYLFLFILLICLFIKLKICIYLDILWTQTKIKFEFLFFKFERNGKFVLKNKKRINSKKIFKTKNIKKKISKIILFDILKYGKYEKLYIYEEVGIIEPFITAMATAIASSITAIPLHLLDINFNNFKYKVVPIYLDLKFNLNIETEISFRIIDIIFSIIDSFLHKLNKKEVKNDECLMNTTMENLKDMIDVNTVIGETIELENGTAIIPVSKVCFGFAAGGSEFSTGTLEQIKKQGLDEETKYNLPFGGGSGAGVNIQPMGFLVVTENSAKILPVNHCSAIDKLIDYIPDLFDKIADIWGGDRTYTYEFYEDDDECKCKKEVTKENENDGMENNVLEDDENSEE